MPISREYLDQPFLTSALGINTFGWFVAAISILIPPFPDIKWFFALLLVMSGAHFFMCLKFMKTNSVRTMRMPMRMWSIAILFNSSLAVIFAVAVQEYALYASAFGFFLLFVSQLLHLTYSFNKKMV